MADGKTRHVFLTALLILMGIANLATAIMWATQNKTIREMFPNLPGLLVPALILVALINLVCLIALFKWKKWGFWGLCATAILGPVVNVTLGLGFAGSVRNIIALLILSGVLQIGKKSKGWPQLD